MSAAGGTGPGRRMGRGRDRATQPAELPPERYEFREVLVPEGEDGTTRRRFLKVLGGGLVVVLVMPRAAVWPGAASSPGETGSSGDSDDPRPAAGTPKEIAAWLQIDRDEVVTVYTGKVEFGQGVRTSLAQELAEELRVPLKSVRMVMGDTDLTPYDMGTFGSRSTPQMGTQLRKAGAAARRVLVRLAAERWSAAPGSLNAANGRVSDPKSGRSATYGELAGGRELTEVVEDDVDLTPASRWTVAGRSEPRVAGVDLVTGAHCYASDMRRPGVLYGKVLRPASIGATLSGLDTSAAEAMDGVVVAHDGEFVGVAAPSTHAAERALGAIQSMWKPAPGPRPSSKTIYDYLRKTRPASEGEREGRFERGSFAKGDPEAALAAAAHRVERTFTVAYIAHTPLEPRAALAEWSKREGGPRLTVWTGTQRPFAVREQLAHAFGMAVPHVRVIVPDTGSGYGGKHTGECAVEAARLAKAAGKPVKLVWTREEEFRWAYFRPAGVIDVRAGASAEGTITAWTFDNYNSGAAAIRPMYEIANQRIEFRPSDSPLRQGSYRGLAATANHFAREMAIDELAQELGQDPLAFRLRNLSDPRLKAVFQAAADRFGWGREPPAGHGVGIAGGFEKGGYVATCAEVAADPDSGSVRIVRAVNAFDCGAIVNPDILRNQVEGGLIQGIGGALFEAIDFRDGVITNAHLADYRVPRFSDIPEIEIVLIDRKEEASFGAGETPLMGIAPAVGAAIFDATGIRPTALPMARGGLSSSA